MHQASKLPPRERQAYLDWLFDMEYRLLELPKPDLVLYLDMPTEITEQMMRHREQSTGTRADIHERDEAYLKACRANAEEVVRRCGWTVIHCEAGDRPRTPQEIHEEVLAAGLRVPARGAGLAAGLPAGVTAAEQAAGAVAAEENQNDDQQNPHPGSFMTDCIP